MANNYSYNENGKNFSSNNKVSSGITIHLSFLRAILLSGIFVMLLIWAFFLGVLMGRGDRPEDRVPEIARIMPGNNADHLKHNSTNSDHDSSANNKKDKGPEIINAEDLDFMETLKTKPTPDDLTKAPLPTNIPPQEGE